MNAAIYLRAATGSSAEQHEAITLQRAVCQAYARARGLDVVYEFTDHGASGATMERPGLNALQNTIDRQAISAIVVVDLDRLAHCAADLMQFIERCTSAGVVIHLANNDGVPDSSSGFGDDDVAEWFVEVYQQTIKASSERDGRDQTP